MRKYSRITQNNNPVPHSTIRGLKLAIQNNKLSSGTFMCLTPSGSKHVWEIASTGTHTCAGYEAKKVRIGKGVVKTNYAAKLTAVTLG